MNAFNEPKLNRFRHAAFVSLAITVFVALPLAQKSLSGIYRLDSDYDMLYPLADIAYKTYTSPDVSLLDNPLIGQGILGIGDPGSLSIHPYFVPAVLLFGPTNGIYALQFLSIWASGISMWYVLRFLGVGGFTLLWGSVLYQLSGGLFAGFASGNVMKLLNYPLIPLCVVFIIQNRISIRRLILMGFFFACMILSSDYYSVWFILLMYAVVRTHLFIRKELTAKVFFRETGVLGLSALVLSAVRIIPFFLFVLPHMERFYRIDAFAGSLHVLLSWIPFTLPLKDMLYGRPMLQRLVGFHFNWYEYYAFVTPIPFILALCIRKLPKNPYLSRLFVIIATGLLYVALGYEYSPFYWLFHAAEPLRQTFRVPQRMNLILLPVVIMTFSILLADSLVRYRSGAAKRVICALLTLSLLWVYIDDQSMMRTALGRTYPEQEYIVRELRRRDPSQYRVASFVCCIQTFLIRGDIPIVNMYYAWRPDDVPSFVNADENGYDLSPLGYFRPKYVILPRGEDISAYAYEPEFGSESIRVWKTENVSVFY